MVMVTVTPAPARRRSAALRLVVLVLLTLCLLLLVHPTHAQRPRRTSKPSTTAPSAPSRLITSPATPPTTVEPPNSSPLTPATTDPSNVRGVSRPRSIRKDAKPSREAADPGMIPWIPALSAHTAGKPWKYKTGDGVIREGREAAIDGKAGEGQAVTEGRTEAKAGEGGEADSLDAEMAPKARKAAKKDARAAKPPPHVKEERQTGESDAEPKPVDAHSTQRSQRDRAAAPAAEKRTVESDKKAALKGAATEQPADVVTAANGAESDDLDFDSALERTKSAHAGKSNKAVDKYPPRSTTPQSSHLDVQATDAAATPAAAEQPAATDPATNAAADSVEAVPAADPTQPATEGGEELSVAGVMPPSQPEPRRTKKEPAIAAEDPLQRMSDSQPTPEVAAAAAATTEQGQPEVPSELAAAPNVDANQPPTNENVPVVGDVDEKRAAEKQAAEMQAVDGQIPADALEVDTQPVAVAESTDSQAAAVMDGLATDTAETPRPKDSEQDSTNTDPLPSVAVDDKPLAAATDDLSIAAPAEASTILTPLPASVPLPATVNTPSDGLDVAGADTPLVAVPPVEVPTPRLRELPNSEEQDNNALKATQDAADVAQPDTEFQPAEVATPAEATPTDASVLAADATPLSAQNTDPVSFVAAPTEGDTIPTPTTDSPPTDTPIAPITVPDATPIESDAAAAAAAAVPAAPAAPLLTDSNSIELPTDTVLDAVTPSRSSDGGAETASASEAATDAEAAAAAAGDDMDSGAWKRSPSTSSTSFLRRSFTAGFVLCVVIGCVVLIGKKVKETLDSHEDEGSESLLGKMEAGQGASSGLLASGVLGELAGVTGKKEEYDGRARVKASIVEEESEEDRYQLQQNKLRSMGQVTSRGMSLTKQPLPPTSKKPTLAVQQVDDDVDTELEEDDEEPLPYEERREEEVGVGANGGAGGRRETKTSDEGWDEWDD